MEKLYTTSTMYTSTYLQVVNFSQRIIVHPEDRSYLALVSVPVLQLGGCIAINMLAFRVDPPGHENEEESV